MKALKRLFILIILPLTAITSKPSAASESEAAAKLYINHGRINLFGLVHQQYYNKLGNEKESSFISKRARLGAKGKLNEYAEINIMAEFAGSPMLLDCIFRLTPSKNISFSIGQYKPPFGTDFLISSTALPFVNSTKAKGIGTDRDIGMSMTVNNKFSENLEVKFDAGIFNGSGINADDLNTNKNFISRLEIGLADMFTIAPNLIVGRTNKVDSLKEELSSYGGSISWEWKREIIVGEYISSESGNIEKTGWYIWGGHTFDTERRFLPEIQVLARYEEYDSDTGIEGNSINRITIGTNLFIDKKYTKISLNYQVNREETDSIDNDEIVLNFQAVF